MGGNPTLLWLWLLGGMLLQLGLMALPFQRWDGLRCLAATAAGWSS